MAGKTQQNFPQAMLPLVEGTGLVHFEWYAFLRSLWTKTGAGTSNTGTMVYLQQETNPANPSGPMIIGAYNCLKGTRLGTVTLT